MDKPDGHFYMKVENRLYFVVVMKKHVSNLDEMNRNELLSHENKKKVIKNLTEFVDATNPSHGDLKESRSF